jgi:hypothetical protein
MTSQMAFGPFMSRSPRAAAGRHRMSYITFVGASMMAAME